MGTESLERLRKAALELLGPEGYDRLVVSVPGALRLGRLRYWQEQLLARISGDTAGFEQFAAAFNAVPLQRPPSKASAETAKELVEAWRTSTEWREQLIASATRELSKHGDLGCHTHVLRELAGALNRDEVLWLFSRLQQSLRVTLEWRSEFLALFPQVSLSDLPSPLFDEEEHTRWSEEQRAAAERERAEEEAEYIRRHGSLPGPGDSIPF